MKCVAKLLLVASLAVPPGTGYAMTIEQMKQLRGAYLLDLRANEIFTKCGLPDVVVDHSSSSPTKKDIHWNSIKMNLSAGNWDLLYQNYQGAAATGLGNDWINPDPVKSPCFSDFSQVTLFTQGGAGVLKIDKEHHKTTYTIPEDLFKTHKVIGYKISLIKPLSVAEITGEYGRIDETVEKDKNNRIIRYWVLVESSQMPVALYAVDFEINNIDNICVAYRVSTSEFDFVRRRFEEFTKMWDRYGID
jgi:hypothetical protein